MYISYLSRFDYKEISGNKIEVYAISNIPNDAERGFYWHLYLHGNQITYPIQTPEFTGGKLNKRICDILGIYKCTSKFKMYTLKYIFY